MSRLLEILADIVTLGVTRYRRIKREEARKQAEEKAKHIKELAEILEAAHHGVKPNGKTD
jgi:hypothetical protein